MLRNNKKCLFCENRVWAGLFCEQCAKQIGLANERKR